jgi:Protein of unknown function (DUF2878)
MPLRSIVPWLAFQVVWLVCAIGAASGSGAPGIAAALVFAAAIITWSQQPLRDALVVAASGIAGFLIESGLVIAGLVRFATPWPIETLAPAWIITLWMAFGVTLPSITGMLGAHRLKMAAALGAVAGPLAYLAGARLGALHLVGSAPYSILVLSLVWAAVMVGLVALQHVLTNDAVAAVRPRETTDL